MIFGIQSATVEKWATEKGFTKLQAEDLGRHFENESLAGFLGMSSAEQEEVTLDFLDGAYNPLHEFVKPYDSWESVRDRIFDLLTKPASETIPWQGDSVGV